MWVLQFLHVSGLGLCERDVSALPDKGEGGWKYIFEGNYFDWNGREKNLSLRRNPNRRKCQFKVVTRKIRLNRTSRRVRTMHRGRRIDRTVLNTTASREGGRRRMSLIAIAERPSGVERRGRTSRVRSGLSVLLTFEGR